MTNGYMTHFQQIASWNCAVGNEAGNPHNIAHDKIRAQCKNILDEFVELECALGLDGPALEALQTARAALRNATYHGFDLKETRDALCDIKVFADGAHHLMGVDADRDMEATICSLYSRFIKSEEDAQASIALHASKGVTRVRLEGQFPTAVLRSTADQPDAPTGKILKSASYSKPVFYGVREAA